MTSQGLAPYMPLSAPLIWGKKRANTFVFARFFMFSKGALLSVFFSQKPSFFG